MDHKAVIFPDTVPSERMLIPLVQVFDQLVYFQAIEDDAVADELNTPFLDAMCAEERCRFLAPVPLADDREKFRHLVEDIRNRRDDYGVQFAQTTLASIPSFARPAKETKSSLVSDLLATKGIRDKALNRQTELVWQARLVLKLAEIFDAEQESLRLEMEALDKRGKDLLDDLRREDEALFSLAATPGPVLPASPEMMRMRLKAWARLCVHGHAVLPDAPFFLTGSEEGFEMLADAFERVWCQAPVRSGLLSLPAACPNTEKGLQLLGRFREETRELRRDFFLGVKNHQQSRTVTVAETWERVLAAFFPAQTYGRIRMRLCYCPGVTAESLFGAAFLGDAVALENRQADGIGLFAGLLERV